MKYFLSLLLIAFLSGCGFTAEHAAKNIGNKVKKSCTSLCLSHKANNIVNTVFTEETAGVSVFSTSVLERTIDMLTW